MSLLTLFGATPSGGSSSTSFTFRKSGGGSALRVTGDSIRGTSVTAPAATQDVTLDLISRPASVFALSVEPANLDIALGLISNLATVIALSVNATAPAVVVSRPTLAIRIDWNRDGDFSDSGEDVTADVVSDGIRWTRGRSADNNAEAIGALEFTLRNEAGQYNAGTLLPGLPVHANVTYLATDYAQFYGFIERVEPDPRNMKVKVTCYDVLRQMSETDVVVAPNTFIQRSAHDMRLAVLEDFERGDRNLIGNPSFETNTTGWTSTGTSLTRVVDNAPGAGTSAAEFVTSAADQTASYFVLLAPVFFTGQVYRLSMYVWTTSGTSTWTIGFLTGVAQERTITATTTKTRVTVTFTMPATATASTFPLTAYIKSTAAGTVRFDGVTVTRGEPLYPYSDTGTGRWPNWVGNGSFDGAALNGWYDGWKNLVSNPSFEVNTTGWTGVTRATTNPNFGVGHGSVTSATPAVYALTGTFKSGVTYDLIVLARAVAGATSFNNAYFGSAATVGDRSAAFSSGLTTSYRKVTATWTPTADRTDAEIRLPVTGDTYIDNIMVTRRDSSLAAGIASYADTGPGGGGSFVTARTTATTQAKYGSRSQQIDTPATATAGRVYDFNHYGSYFQSGQPFTLSLWIYPTSSMPYKVGLSANAGDGTFDEATTTGTAAASTWTQVTVTWTPSANRSSSVALDTMLFVYQTDATARTFYVDGVRVIPGSSADDFEMAHWSLANGAEATDIYSTAASLSGSALSSLSTLNALTLTRHYIDPTTTSPWYQYRTIDRTEYGTKISGETYADDINDMAGLDIDRAMIVNVVPVAYSGGTEYYSDETSVDTYGPRPTSSINGSQFYPDRTVPDSIGAALLARYKDPRARPTITVQNRWPSMLQRDLDDLVTLTVTRLGITLREYLIQTIEISISEGGNLWTAVYTLEEQA